MFLKNLQPYISKYIQDEDCWTIDDAYCEAHAANQKAKVATAAYQDRKNNQNKNKNNQKRSNYGNNNSNNNTSSNTSSNNNNILKK